MTPIQAYRSWLYPKTLHPNNVKTAKIRNMITIFAAIPIGVALNFGLSDSIGKSILEYGLFCIQIMAIARFARLTAIGEALDTVVTLMAALAEPEKFGNMKILSEDKETGEVTDTDVDEKLEITVGDMADALIKNGHQAVQSAFLQMLKTFHDDTACTRCRGRNRHADDHADESEPESENRR